LLPSAVVGVFMQLKFPGTAVHQQLFLLTAKNAKERSGAQREKSKIKSQKSKLKTGPAPCFSVDLGNVFLSNA
jgi:hypothetical protein